MLHPSSIPGYNPDVDKPFPEELKLLDQAITKAEKLLLELIQQQTDLEKNPPKIPAADLAMGRMAMQNAIASAQRTVTALRDARKLAHEDLSDGDAADDQESDS